MSRAVGVVVSSLALIAVSAVVAGGVAAKPAGAGPGPPSGNSPSSKLCQKGGWQSLARSDGSGFSSEQACTAYAAGGGTLVNVAPCLNNGWRVVLRSDDTLFQTEEECRSYVAGGGTLTSRYPDAKALCESYGGTFGGGPNRTIWQGTPVWVCNDYVTPDFQTYGERFSALERLCQGNVSSAENRVVTDGRSDFSCMPPL